MSAATAPASVPSKRLVDTLSPAEKEKQINDLLKDLEAATNTGEKKKIRRSLRSRGYFLSKQPKVEAVAAQAADNKAKGQEVAEEILAMNATPGPISKKAKAKAASRAAVKAKAKA